MALDTWRLTVTETDLSSFASPSAGNVGATVIESLKGPEKPIYIYKGNEKKLVSVFGQPSSSNKHIWDVIEYNKTADVWVSAPVSATNSLYGGVIVTQTGTIPFVSGLAAKEIGSFSAVSSNLSVGTGDGVITAFSTTLDSYSRYNSLSLDAITIGTDTYELSGTLIAGTETLTSNPDVGTGSYVVASGLFTFNFSTAPVSGTSITVHYTINCEDAYFALFNTNPQVDDLAVKVSLNASTSTFNIDAFQIINNNYIALQGSPVEVSLTAGVKDGNGKGIFIEDIFENDPYIYPQINNSVVTTFTNDTSNVDFNGGNRGDVLQTADLARGWAYFQSGNKYAADIFFDVSADASIPAIFNTLRNTYQKYKAYILPLPMVTATTAISTKAGYSISNRGVYFYWNWGKVRNNYTTSKFYSPLTGKVAAKHAAMVDVYNGLAPCWIDTDSHGGQLGGDIIEMLYDISETESKNLDNGQVNPIVYNSNYGFMITSQRTSLTTLSDYSFIGHSRLADYIISNTIEFVIPNQIEKLNNNTNRTKARVKTESILSPLLAEPLQLLRQGVVKCDSENNNDIVLSQKKFVLAIGVKFTPFSRLIDLIFTNVDQTTDVNDVI